MQSTYIKQLAIKTYQEDLQKEYYRSRRQSFHMPSFAGGIIVSIFVIALL